MVQRPATRKTQNMIIASFGLNSSGLRLLRDQVVRRAHEAEEQPDDEQVGMHHARR